MFKMFKVWGSTKQRNRANWGQNLQENLFVQKYTKSWDE